MADEQDTNRFQPKSLVIKIAVFICVLVIGAAIFQAIEKDQNSKSKPSVAKEIKINLTSKYNMSSADVLKLYAALEEEIQESVRANKPRWSFSNSVFLAFSIMTTIGYGHLTPNTWQGQLFCIFYSLFAIPVTGIMLISVGNHVSLALQKFIGLVERKMLRREVPFNPELKSTVVTFIFMIVIIISGALLTSHTDNWSFVEGAYFIFISLSTIGFGDYIINDGQLKDPDDGKTVAVNFTIVLITVGLCVVSSVLCSVSSVIEEKQKRMKLPVPGAVAMITKAPTRVAFTAVSKLVGKREREPLNEETDGVEMNNV